MRTRNGFVSNSSSSSFLLIADTEIPSSVDFLRTFLTDEVAKDNWGDSYYRYSDGLREFFSNIENVPVFFVENEGDNCPDNVWLDVEFPSELDFGRSNIRVVRTIEDKIQYIYSIFCNMAAMKSKTPEEYFNEALDARTKICSIARKYRYQVSMEILPLYAYRVNKGEMRYNVGVSTECEYAETVYEMFKSSDTSELEKFIFNPKSFALLGGDEYEETFILERQERKRIESDPYPYHRIADSPDIKKGDVLYYEDGEPVLSEHDYEWGKDDAPASY